MRRIFVWFVLFVVLVIALSGSQVVTATKFRLPLASNPGYYAWYDHNASAGATLKYDCTPNISYDGHRGTDFATTMGTNIYAAANGTIYYYVNNCPDGSDPSCGGSYGNHIRMTNGDGVAIYAHLQYGTVNTVPASLSCGTYIGKSGNSGLSHGTPHLHFELWSDASASQRLDFFGGSCNGQSYWVNQNNGWPTTQCQ